VHPDPFGPLLARDGVLVLDGGLATQLEAQGHDLSDRLWSARLLVEDPGAIVDAHLAYFRAGARVATTASYQATFEGFAGRGIDHDDAVALLRRSVELAGMARDRFRAERATAGAPDPDPLFVAASIGPYAAMLADGSEYRGRYGLTVDELVAFHRERLVVLAATGADALAVETIPELEEAMAIVRLLDETPAARAWVSFSCADGGHLRSGVPIEAAVEAVAGSPGVVAVGVNCTAPEHVEALIRRARSATTKPIIAYPNSGEGWDAAARRWTGSGTARVDPASARRWYDAGAVLIGGCCRVTPDQIALVAAGLAAREHRSAAPAPR
jgi:homocysteine S-methyltransferase